MEIALTLFLYYLIGLATYTGMVFLERKGFRFELREDGNIVIMFIITIVASPLILFILYPLVIFNRYIK